MTTNMVLVHHGILGQKWGVRRYQNEDGSLTKVGKERYSQGGAKDALTEDYQILHLRAAGHKLSTAKNAIMTLGHENRYKTANEVYDEIKQKIEKKGFEHTGENERFEYIAMGYRMNDLKKAGLENVKGVSVVADRHSSNAPDVSFRYRYYTDDAVEPTYYDSIKELKEAIEETERNKKETEEKKKQVEEKLENNGVVQKNKNLNDKVNDAVNSLIGTVKNLPSSAWNAAKDAITSAKSFVQNLLKEVGRDEH